MVLFIATVPLEKRRINSCSLGESITETDFLCLGVAGAHGEVSSERGNSNSYGISFYRPITVTRTPYRHASQWCFLAPMPVGLFRSPIQDSGADGEAPGQ